MNATSIRNKFGEVKCQSGIILIMESWIKISVQNKFSQRDCLNECYIKGYNFSI